VSNLGEKIVVLEEIKHMCLSKESTVKQTLSEQISGKTLQKIPDINYSHLDIQSKSKYKGKDITQMYIVCFEKYK
jgi:hypothetical protein